MRKTLAFLLGAVVAIALFAQASSARTGSPVTMEGVFDFLDPGTEAFTVVQDPSDALCPTGIGQAAKEPGDETRGPRIRGGSDRFVGAAFVLVTCVGAGWGSADTYTLRVTVKGTGAATAEGTWSIVEAAGRLAGLHGGGDYSALIDPFPIVNNTYTGFVHTTP